MRLWCLLCVWLVAQVVNAQSTDELLARAKTVLSPLDGDIKLPGLRQPVEVLRDRWGIAHIYAQNTHDLFLAQGFVVAQDRLFQIDLWRRVGLGELAEIYGESSLAGDRFARLIKYRGDMAAEWASYSSDTQEIASAFTTGINAWIDQCHDKLPIEFQLLGYRPKKWQREDILARMSGLVMVSNWEKEIARAMLIANVGLDQARLVAPTDPPVKFEADPQLDLKIFSPKVMEGYLAATRPLRFTPSKTEGSKSESNNWVIDGTMSASGKPMLAGDPHRATTLPSLRYLVHLNAPGWNVIGAGEPALPGVAIGHNDRVAWAFTIVGTDQADLFIEETHPENPHRYKVGDAWQDMRVVHDQVQVKGRAEAERVELCFTRHGPVIYQDKDRHVAIALKWVGSEPGSAGYLGSLAVGRTKNAAELVQSLERWKIPALNFVFADVEGAIGWVAAGLTPIRPSTGLLPVPGASTKYDWQGFLKVSQLPQTHNPTKHFVATANHNILPHGYGHQVAYDWAAPFRFQRIEQRLTAPQKFTLDDFQSIQHEATSLLGQQLVAVLKSNAQSIPQEHAAALRVLTDWNGVLSRDSAGAALYSVWLHELMNRFFETRLPTAVKLERGELRTHGVLLSQIQKPSREWFGEHPEAARNQLLNEAFVAAVARTQKLLGSDVSQWSWGRLHTATFRHPLSTLGPTYERAFNLGPVARSGDGTTPNNTRASDDFQQIHGASYRHVLDLADWDRGLATSVPGQSGQPGSPHYGDLLPFWAEERYFPLSFSRGKINEMTEHRLQLTP